ncbi:MAG: thiamine phosphate synthase [Hyphomicrobiales bacterium]|nr:thiamine phosphate synthase [Hyphomicrobiales bacterium]MDE2113957.1 thiamine phosphate synthase [Hyphomicrobiales bacterium]
MTLNPFYPIVPNAEWVARLAPAGIGLVQLRMKDQSPVQVHEGVAAALKICNAHNITLVVNDHWQIAIDLGATFVHLGQEDLDSADIKAIRSHGLRIGISTHDDRELSRALEYAPDYVALGPIWPTTLKVMPFAPQGLQRITEWKRRIGNIPLVAIGGITLERAPGCYAAGADVVSVVSDVTGAADPVARAKAWLDLRATNQQ